MTENKVSSTLFFRRISNYRDIALLISSIISAHIFLFLLLPLHRPIITISIWLLALILLSIKSYSIFAKRRGAIKKSWALMLIYTAFTISGLIIKVYCYNTITACSLVKLLPFLFFSANISIAAVLLHMGGEGKTPYDARRQSYLIGIILITLIILSYILNIHGYAVNTDRLHIARSLMFSYSGIFVITIGLSIYWINIWRKEPARKIIFLLILSGVTLSFFVSLFYYTPRLLAGSAPEGGFPDILLTVSICMLITAAWLETSDIPGKKIKQSDAFNILYVSRVERIIPALCILLITFSIFYKRNTLENDVILILTILLIPFAIFLGLFEWSSYRSESWFLFMLSNSPMGVQITDIKMEKNLFLNRSFCRIFGTGEITPDIILSGSSSDSIKKIMKAVKNGESLEDEEMEIIRPDGSMFHARVRITPAKYYSRRILIFWLQDITEEKKYEEMILRERDTAETSNRYRGTLLENISAKMMSGYIVGEIDNRQENIDFIITDMNRQAMNILAGGNDLTGMSFSGIFPSPSPHLINPVVRVWETGISERIEIYSRRLDKYLLIVLFTTDHNEIACLINDITGNRKIEKELAEKEREIRNLLSNLPGMAYRCLNDKNWTMNFVSRGSIELSGYTPEEITSGKIKWDDVIHIDDRANVWLNVQRAIEQKDSFHVEFRIITKKGDLKHVWEKGSGIYDDSGELLFLEGFILDVTKQVEAEAALRQSEEKLRQTEKLNAIAQMAGGIAHDLNNNLMAIQSLSSLIEIKSADKGLKKYTDSINDVIGKASILIEKMETFAKKKDLSSEIISINKMLTDVISLLKLTFPDNINVHFSFDAVKDKCRGDHTQIDNALLYICMNAKEAMHQGGTLSIITENIHLNEDFFPQGENDYKPGEYIRIKISDTGYGIEKQDMNRLFEPFFTTKPVGKGTGLSLSAVFGTIQSHRGIITVESEAGKGTSFIIFLPIA